MWRWFYDSINLPWHYLLVTGKYWSYNTPPPQQKLSGTSDSHQGMLAWFHSSDYRMDCGVLKYVEICLALGTHNVSFQHIICWQSKWIINWLIQLNFSDIILKCTLLEYASLLIFCLFVCLPPVHLPISQISHDSWPINGVICGFDTLKYQWECNFCLRAEMWTNTNSLSNYFSEDRLVWSYLVSFKPTPGHFKTKHQGKGY